MSTLMESTFAPSVSRSAFYTLSQRGGTMTIRFTGPRLGEAQATVICPDIKDTIDQMRGSFKRLVLDLSEVRVMSSYGLGLCIELRNHARLHHGETALSGLCPDIRELFRIMNVDRLFTIALSEKHLAEIIG